VAATSSGRDWPQSADVIRGRTALGSVDGTQPSPGSRADAPSAAAAAAPHLTPATSAPAVWSWGLATVFAASVAAGVFSFHQLGSVWLATNELSAAHIIETRVLALLSSLKDAETGQRGYLLTRDRAYLKPYADALVALPLETTVATESIAANRPELLGLMGELKRLIHAKTTELARTIALADEGQLSSALAIVRDDLGKQSMDAIRRIVVTVQTAIDADSSAGTIRIGTLAARSAGAFGVTLAGTLCLLMMLRRTRISAARALENFNREAVLHRAAQARVELLQRLELEVRRDAGEAIEKRRLAEENLTVSELNLSATLASIGAGFIATDKEGRVTRMNAVAEQTTGWNQAEARSQSLWEVFVREDKPADYASTNPVDLMDEQGTTAGDIRHVVATSRGGVRSELDVQTAVTRSDDGVLRGAVVVFRNATREVRAEAESARLGAIVASSTDAVIGKTLDGRITNWNRAAQDLFGYTAEEAVGRLIQMLIPPEREDEEMRILANLAQGVRVPAFDTVRLAKGGARVQVSVAISPIRDSLGRVVGASKIARDITRRQEAEASLHVSEERLRFALDSAKIGNWDLDLRTGAARCSLRHDRCFGYETAQADWNFARFEQHVHPQDRVEAVRKFRAAVAASADWSLECRVVWPDKSTHWIRVHGSRLEEGGDATRMLGIVTDITEDKHAEDARLRFHQLETENRQFQEATRLKSLFLANMSHELRTPLNAIIGFAELIHSGAVQGDPLKERLFVGHICTSGRHLLQLINDVLDLSKVEAGKFEFFPEPVDPGGLIRELSDVLQTSLLQKKIHLTVEIEPTLGPVVVDAARLKQALFNYLSNAIKFSADRGRIQVRVLPDGATQFRIEVEDDGIGIAEADVPRLFSDFQQLDASFSKRHQGTGLGLALTRRLVRAQGGDVGVRSTLGQGSVFHLVLDRAPIQTLPARNAEAMPNGALATAARVSAIGDAAAPS
jgi:PAS domain S-box-containing protein